MLLQQKKKKKKSYQAAKRTHFVRNHQLSSLFKETPACQDAAATENITGGVCALVRHNREFFKLLGCKGSKLLRLVRVHYNFEFSEGGKDEHKIDLIEGRIHTREDSRVS